MNISLLSNKLILPTALLVVVIISSVVTVTTGGDFDVYLDAARKLNEGKNIYRPPFILGLQYYYSVFFALILVPFSYTVFVTEVSWSLLSYFLLYRTWKLAERYFDFPKIRKNHYRIWLGLTLLLALQFIIYNVSRIQITFFLLWGMFESLDLINKRRNLLGGILLGLVINIKIMPVLLLAYLFYRGYFRALSIALATFIILLFVPSLIIGNDYNQFLLSEWWSTINPANPEHMFETGIGTHSLVSAIPVYLTETIGEMDFKRNILNLTHQHVKLITNVIRLFVLLLSLLYLKSLPFKKENNKLKSFWEISFFILLIPLLLPHQQKYAFMLAIPMVSYVVYFFIETLHYPKTTGYYFALCIFGISMAVYSPLYGTDWIGTFLYRLTQHYRLLTFSTLLIIPVSLYCSPSKMKLLSEQNSGK